MNLFKDKRQCVDIETEKYTIKWYQTTNELEIYNKAFEVGWALEEWLNSCFEGPLPNEEMLAEKLIQLDAPKQIEDVIIAKFNERKRKHYLFLDKVKLKKQEVLKSYDRTR